MVPGVRGVSKHGGVGGSCIRGGAAKSRSTLACGALYGPVCTAKYDPIWLGAERGTNNTGELTAMGEACKWLLELDVRQAIRTAEILYDSEYAYGVATRLIKDKVNTVLGESV